ncbi:MerR family transcriptional regulator [Helcococcus ovis]|uniref:MerR family transcriptional regulator n=1 Tax=Helcococcus ovis TaxID=72026 RepID=A0A4R9C2C1_9FIRM|nr:MerR family transcriptional regulator [Helcococcus ovis]TFF64378.1 MerR family transcriptional regulator [Helcococcus ovis]TFF67111.1 MerR family transcriptional regulator [Helcococcus ovis]
MLRNEIQEKTGLTRKAIEYYEEKGLIKPLKLENGYRDYSNQDLETLNKIYLFRKIGLRISEIEECLSSSSRSLASILRRKEYHLEIEQKRKEVIELMVKKESQDIINGKIALIEAEESIYEKLENAFPGYFGQLIFSAYQPFLNETLDEEGKVAYKEFVTYLDSLPSFTLTKEEQEYIEEVSTIYDMNTLKEVNESKIKAIENSEKWLEENKEILSQYQDYKNSYEYQNSLMKIIQDKLQKYMQDNKYYEIAIPLIRKFSKGYNEYYRKLFIANDEYLKIID